MSSERRGDTVFLHDLRVETVIGLWDWEREIRQTVSIDLEMGTDIRQAAATTSRTMPKGVSFFAFIVFNRL